LGMGREDGLKTGAPAVQMMDHVKGSSQMRTYLPERETTTEQDGSISRIRSFLRRVAPDSPCMVIDTQTVRQRYLELCAAFPGVRLHYAVKANPAPEVLSTLAELGASFDVASRQEIELCLQAHVPTERISYGNTIKKRTDIRYAYSVGVRSFTTDSASDVETIAEAAPGSSVFCRLLPTDLSSPTSMGRKFGCSPEMAYELFIRAASLNLRTAGLSFHVGSPQLNPHAWDASIGLAAKITTALAAQGIELPALNIGGGLPACYAQPAPPLTEYTEAIAGSLRRYFGSSPPRLMAEPGRFIVADAGLLRSQVILVSRKSTDDPRRWVYLDVGRYGGLAETENEYITYRIASPDRSGGCGPVVLAGPTCDQDDVIYYRNVYWLPLNLRAGDHLDFLSAGAYTATYSAVGFNGFPPLSTYYI
jgi:ornithine decarboxylase